MRARGADRRAEIVEATIGRLARFGFEGLRVRDVAQDVGINNATLHHHFPTKADLIHAVVERFRSTFKIEAAGPPSGTVEERLAAHRRSALELMERVPTIYIILNELLIRAQRDGDIAKIMADMQDSWRAHLVGLCRDAGADAASAYAAAERCRHELIGLSLDRGLRRPRERPFASEVLGETKPEPSKPEPSKPKPSKPKPTRPKSTKPKPTRPKPTRPKPSTPPASSAGGRPRPGSRRAP